MSKTFTQTRHMNISQPQCVIYSPLSPHPILLTSILLKGIVVTIWGIQSKYGKIKKNTFTAASIAGHIVSDRTRTAVTSRCVNTSM